jgi:His-Xaa-Ser system protein HxsD
MENIKFPISAKGENGFVIQVDTRIYDKSAITAAIYRYTDRFYIHQQINSRDTNIIDITFENKSDGKTDATSIKLFCNDLIDQQLRHDVNAKFGHIRDLIVEEAFKPISHN